MPLTTLESAQHRISDLQNKRFAGNYPTSPEETFRDITEVLDCLQILALALLAEDEKKKTASPVTSGDDYRCNSGHNFIAFVPSTKDGDVIFCSKCGEVRPLIRPLVARSSSVTVVNNALSAPSQHI